MVRKIVCALLIGSSLVAIEHLVEQELVPSGLLIFLDDYESKISAITESFLAAFTQDAGPIVVSASIIAHINELQKSPAVPHERALEVVRKKKGERNNDEKQIYDTLFIAKLDLKLDRWIVKEINPSLHLLLPKKYLQGKEIGDDAVQQMTPGPTTATEQALGLKVNHLNTVNFADIRRPQNKKPDEYFVKSLDALFVIHRNYKKAEKRIAWSLYIEGHGQLGESIVGLSLDAFKKFLQFVDTTITTRLLIYNSCYAAGVNANLLYQDIERGADTTYSFAIVTAALTDAPTGGTLFAFLEKKNDDIVVEYFYSGGWARPERKNTKLYLFDSFVEEIGKPDIDYAKAVDFIIPTTIATGAFVPPGASSEHVFEFPYATVPQIKYPGLSWFSVLDRHQVLTIGSILAKTWNRPFDFAKRSGKYAKKPQAILLYAQDIPFELIDNIFSETFLRPLTFISMIPGDAVHHIKKITSPNISIEEILNSFFIKDLKPRKLFVIDAIQAPFFTGEHTHFGVRMDTFSQASILVRGKQSLLTQVIISLERNRYHIFFSYEGKLYEILEKHGLPSQTTNVAEHQKLWQEYGQWNGTASGLQKAPLPPESLALIKTNIQNKIENIADLDQTFFKNLLRDIPLNVVVHIEPKVTMRAPTLGIDVFDDLIGIPLALMDGGRKIVWFSEVVFIAPDKTHLLKDLILDASQFTTTLFATAKDTFYKNFYKITENYMPTYDAVFKYFNQHQTLEGFEKSPRKEGVETQPLQQQLTKEAIARIKAAQEKKIQKIKEAGARQMAVQVPPPPTAQEIEQALQREEEAERKHQAEAQRLRQEQQVVVETAPQKVESPAPAAPPSPTPQRTALPIKRAEPPTKLKKRPIRGKIKKTKKSARPRRLRKKRRK